MIELVNGNEVVKVPEEMTIRLYQKFMLNKEKYTDEPIELISLFTDIPPNKLKNLSVKTIQMINNFIRLRMVMPDTKQLITTFTYDGVEYGLETDMGKMAWGAWVDLEVYSSDNILQNIHKIMAVLYRPVVSNKNGKYKIEPYDSDTILERAEVFLDISVSLWFQASDFFLSVANLSITIIKASLERRMRYKMMMMRGMRILPKWVQKRVLQDFILT